MKKKKSIKNSLINLFLFLMLLVGLALVFNEPIKTFLLKQRSNQYRVSDITKDQIVENKKKETTFDFDAVEAADLESVLRGTFSDEDLYVLGGIAIPSVSINLPIYKGLSDAAITFGAGTMTPEQEMGEGNYSLASHHMINPEILFGPLVNIQLGTPMYLTDLEYIYEYTVTYKEYVAPTRVDLLDIVPDKTLLTLITCDYTGANRLAVQGELAKKTPIKEASPEIADAFGLSINR
ncbi:hypothetical protein T233_00746 [Vagococcus lutrae LBD1]|uniref:Sortase n=1 Tax=Vagococcus lutrae LBD1 TaxID=1408226 RepID=V6Q699_9ENTE|nr:class A sortase [Vagococcus lutrae]EST90180.1 hypothetical protein T233_00746 [Vagococcus lutrae LBD1]